MSATTRREAVPRSGTITLAVQALLCAMAVVVAGSSFGVAYTDDTFPAAVIGVTASSFLTVVIVRRHAPAGLALLLGLVAAFVTAVITGRSAPDQVVDSARGALPTLFSVVLPITRDPEVATGLLLVVGATAVLTASLLVDTRLRAGVLVPPIALFTLAVVVASGTSERLMSFALALVCLSAVFLLTRGSNLSPAGLDRGSTVAGAAVMVVLVVGGGVLVGDRVAPESRARTAVRLEEPADPAALLGPLGIFRTLRGDSPDDVVAEVRIPEGVERLRLGVLEAYDGVSWGAGTEYAPTGGRLPLGDPAPELLETTVSLQRLPGRFLPMPPEPVEIDGVAAEYSPTSGAVVVAGGGSAGSRSYRVVHGRDPEDAVGLTIARPASDPEAQRALDLVRSPSALEAEGLRFRDGYIGTYNQLKALEAQLTDENVFSVSDQPTQVGVSVPILRKVLTPDDAAPIEVSLEQLVTIFALLADHMDVPTRVAVGLITSGSGGVQQLHGADAHIWPEARLDGLGWVPFELSADVEPVETQREAEELASETLETADAPQPEMTPPPDEEPSESSEASPVDQSPPAWRSTAAVLGLVLISLLAVPVLKLLRRRRRRRLSPAEATEAAWLELVERLADVRVDVPPGDTLEEATQRVGATAPAAADSVGRVGRSVEVAVYGGRVPDDSEVDQTWLSVDEAVASARRCTGSVTRALAPFRLRGIRMGRRSR